MDGDNDSVLLGAQHIYVASLSGRQRIVLIQPLPWDSGLGVLLDRKAEKGRD